MRLELAPLRDSDAQSPQQPIVIPPGAYSRANEDTLRQVTGMSLKTLFNKIVAHNSPHHPTSTSPSPSSARASMMRRNSSLSNASPQLRAPSMDDSGYASHILVSMPIPESVARAVCELWTRRIDAARCWWLFDDIDFESPNEDALFVVVRLALIERLRTAQQQPPEQQVSVCEPGQVVLFAGDDTNFGLQKAIVAARTLTGGDAQRVALLDQILRRRVAAPDYQVQHEDILPSDNLAAWQAGTSAVLRHVFCADGALRNSELVEALCLAWEQIYLLNE